jgi:hypothetical protein
VAIEKTFKVTIEVKDNCSKTPIWGTKLAERKLTMDVTPTQTIA